jgi:hypothetical protein
MMSVSWLSVGRDVGVSMPLIARQPHATNDADAYHFIGTGPEALSLDGVALWRHFLESHSNEP